MAKKERKHKIDIDLSDLDLEGLSFEEALTLITQTPVKREKDSVEKKTDSKKKKTK